MKTIKTRDANIVYDKSKERPLMIGRYTFSKTDVNQMLLILSYDKSVEKQKNIYLINKVFKLLNNYKGDELNNKSRKKNPYGSFSKRIAFTTFLFNDIQNYKITCTQISGILKMDHTTVIRYVNIIRDYNLYPDEFSESINKMGRYILDNLKDLDIKIKDDAVLQYYERN